MVKTFLGELFEEQNGQKIQNSKEQRVNTTDLRDLCF